MNYRHAFHAGNFADVLKHVVLVELLYRLAAKPRPLLLLDTHAGAGAYDLQSQAALRSNEAQLGVLRLLRAPEPPEAVARYLAAIRRYDRYCGHRGEGLAHYPGSPRLMKAAARPGDRIVLCELQPEAMSRLRREFAGDRQVTLRDEDGYGVLKASLPPPERRGLVLIDPPYERSDDALRAVRALAQAHRRFATGVYALWYPVKADEAAQRMLDRVCELGLPATLQLELRLPVVDAPMQQRRSSPRHRRAPLVGCGVIVVNPPWKFEPAMAAALPWLASNLAPGAARTRLHWLVSQKAAAVSAGGEP